MSARKRAQSPPPDQEAEQEEVETSDAEDLAKEAILSPEVLAPEDDEAEPEPTDSLPVVHAPGDKGHVSALTRYMAELRHHAPISREEEHALAVRWVEEGDIDSARQLVLANLRIVVKIAMDYRRAWANTLDLIQ
ncbi:MAG: hypothetical protein VCC20_06085, partial [Myxococcota bacterium]